MNIKHPNLKFYFHTHEKYFPSTFEYVASNSELVVDNQNLGVKSQVELAQYNCDGKDVYINMSHSIKHGMKDLDFPLYYFARNVGEFLYITYFMVYPYNGDYNLILAKTGGHWGDIERLTLEYDKNGNLTRVYFGAHGDKDGRWIEYKDLEIEDNSIGGGGSGFPFSGSAVITGSLLISGSNVNELVVSGNVIATQGFTGSLFGTASWANNVISASHGVTASYVNNLNQNLSITGAVVLSGSSLPELRVIGETQLTGSVFISGGFEAQGISGSKIYLGTHIVGAVDVTGSGLIISSSNLPSSHYNFVKIGNTELVDYNLVSNRFFINNVDSFYVRSGGLSDGGDILTNTGLLLEHKEGTFKVYSTNNSTPLTVGTTSTVISSNTTGIKAAETTNLNYLLAFDSNPSSNAQTIGWVLPSKFITSTGSSAGQVISGSGNIHALRILGGSGSISALIVTGGLSVNGGITGSLLGTASWANNVVSASHGVTASYVNDLNQNVSINGTLTVSNTTTLNGNLIVNGTASFFGSSSFINVQNLAIEDKFILLNSGSKGTPSYEGGIIIQTSASSDNVFGTAIFYDQDANRWMVARSSSVAANATSITVGTTTDYIVTVSASVGAPTGAPVNFGDGGVGNYSLGQMYIQTNTSDIYIYA